jgi:uncharacterized protein with HEPN domain
MHRTALHFLEDIKEAAGRIKKYTAGMSYDTCKQVAGDDRPDDRVERSLLLFRIFDPQ